MRKSSRGNPYHDEYGRFTTADGCITRSEQSAREYEQRTVERQQAGYDFTDKEVVKQYLTEQFEANGYKPVEIKTSEGWVYIEPYCYADEPSLDKVEFYNIEGPVPWMGSSTLDGACNEVASISESVKSHKESKKELAEFYKNNIEGATEEDKIFSRKVISKVMEDWKGDSSLDEFYEAHRSEYAQHFGISEKELDDAYQLQEALGTYSDWHKDLYGFRPR